ncbi:hypothetical protein KSF78_0009434 [Schistosoma japonicum]|nr:hypothetical protein KSF78_0009434 [Schistosoma japonicum]
MILFFFLYRKEKKSYFVYLNSFFTNIIFSLIIIEEIYISSFYSLYYLRQYITITKVNLLSFLHCINTIYILSPLISI